MFISLAEIRYKEQYMYIFSRFVFMSFGNIDGNKFNTYQQNDQLPFTSNH